MVGALAIGLMLSGVDVVGEGPCPAPAEVSRRLAEMRPAADTSGDGPPGAHRLARLSRAGGRVHVELVNPDGLRLDERALEANERCEDLAAAVAVVVAAWEAQLDPRVGAARVSLPAPPAGNAAAVAAVQPPRPPPRSPASFELGLALLASLTGGQMAPGARLAGWIAPAGWRVGLGLAAFGTTSRSEAVVPAPAEARWTRIAFAAGPEARFMLGRTMVGVHLQGLAALLHVEGAGLAMNASDSSAQFGTAAGLRVGRSWGNATPWVGADLLFWPGHERLEIAGLGARGELPRLELQLALGLSLGRLP